MELDELESNNKNLREDSLTSLVLTGVAFPSPKCWILEIWIVIAKSLYQKKWSQEKGNIYKFLAVEKHDILYVFIFLVRQQRYEKKKKTILSAKVEDKKPRLLYF